MTDKVIFKSKSATRVDLAGGTLDLWPLSSLVEGASTINCSISCYTSVEFKKSSVMTVSVESPDFKEVFEFENLEAFFLKTSSKLVLLQEAFSAFESFENGIGLWVIKSESPAGSGLGGSSSVLISILKVIFEVEGRSFTEEGIINSAKNIESRVLRGPAGIQDYFSPVKEGLNKIIYKDSGFCREDISESLEFWSNCISVVDSEIKHHSGMNNWEILKKYIDEDPKVVKALKQISKVASLTLKAVESKSIEGLIKCFQLELEARKEVSNSYINEDLGAFLDKLEETAGVLAVKICGAGGGGCVLVLHSPENKTKVQKVLKSGSISVLPFELTKA